MTNHPNHRTLTRHTAATAEGDAARVLGKLESRDQDLTIVRFLAGSRAFRPFVLMSSALLNESAVPARTREVVIMWMAERLGIEYEWAEHVPMSADAGVSAEQLDAIRSGQLDGALEPDDLLAVEIAGSLLDGNGIPEPLWARAVDVWGDVGVLDLTLAVGWWGGFVPTVIGALGLVGSDA